jgi:transcriptional regulator GlxA family with amidase domain
MTPPAQHHAFVLLPRFSLLALSGALEALAAANEVLAQPLYSTALLSLDGAPVRAACGTAVPVAQALPASTAADTATPAPHAAWVVAPSTYPDPARDGHAPLHGWLRRCAAAGATLGGLDTGAAVLAQAGLLAQRRVTLPAALASPLAQAHAEIIVSSNLYEIDTGRLTCAGGTASLDLLLAWLGQRHGPGVLQALLAHFGLERLRPRDERQRTPAAAHAGVASPKLAEALALMEANLAEPLPTEDVARLVGVSRRQLERLFKQHLDALPSRWYAELRLARARRLLQQTGQSILQIGLACGFASGSHFSNAYRGRYGHTPREERSQRAAAWRDHAAPAPAPEETPSP